MNLTKDDVWRRAVQKGMDATVVDAALGACDTDAVFEMRSKPGRSPTSALVQYPVLALPSGAARALEGLKVVKKRKVARSWKQWHTIIGAWFHEQTAAQQLPKPVPTGLRWKPVPTGLRWKPVPTGLRFKPGGIKLSDHRAQMLKPPKPPPKPAPKPPPKPAPKPPPMSAPKPPPPHPPPHLDPQFKALHLNGYVIYKNALKTSDLLPCIVDTGIYEGSGLPQSADAKI